MCGAAETSNPSQVRKLVAKTNSVGREEVPEMIGILFIVALLVFDLLVLRRIGNPYG